MTEPQKSEPNRPEGGREPPMQTFDVLTVREAAEVLRIRSHTLYRLLRAGEGPRSVTVGGSIRITRESLRCFLNDGR